MNLPSNLRLLPGVQQRLNGKKFILGVYPSGKTVEVPYEETGAPPAQMIPEPKQSQPAYKPKVITTTNSKGEKVPVRHIPRRLMVVRYRKAGQKAVAQQQLPNADGAHLVAQEVRNLMRSPDCGRTWLPVGKQICDHYVQWHIDEEVK